MRLISSTKTRYFFFGKRSYLIFHFLKKKWKKLILDMVLLLQVLALSFFDAVFLEQVVLWTLQPFLFSTEKKIGSCKRDRKKKLFALTK